MPKWQPETVWKDADVYVIGGGNSLKEFDWSLLKDKHTIGCNDAYQLGAEICRICVFGDAKWFYEHKDNLQKYQGTIFTNDTTVSGYDLDYIWHLPRQNYGLGCETLAWNNNTGALAINLALLLGAKRVFLLGFDFKLSKDGQANWHPNNLDKPDSGIYNNKFLSGFMRLKNDLFKFPDSQIFNITNDSNLKIFPIINADLFWNERNSKNENYFNSFIDGYISNDSRMRQCASRAS